MRITRQPLRLISWVGRLGRTRSLLRRASLNNWAADLVSRLRWKLVRPYRVAPGTRLVFHGKPAPHRIVVEVDEDKPPVPPTSATASGTYQLHPGER